MSLVIDEKALAKMKLDAEMAIMRSRKILAFMEVVCENERRILRDTVQNTGVENVRTEIQNQESYRRP